MTTDIPRLLVDLGLGLDNLLYAPDARRLFLRYRDGRAYVLDLDWLRAMGGDLEALSPDELARLACEGPLASGAWDEAALAPYLEGREPQACR